MSNFRELTTPEDTDAPLREQWRRKHGARAAEKTRQGSKTIIHMQRFAPKVVKDLKWLWPAEPKNPRSGLTPAQAVVVEAQRQVARRMLAAYPLYVAPIC